MNNEKDKINNILKEANEEIQPRDSWQALRSRIDKKIESGQTDTGLVTKLNGHVAFWRRTALAAAACLVFTSALLIYVAFNSKNENNFDKHNLLAQNQLQQLSEAFSQVQELFNQNCPWIVINSTGNGDIGIENQEINLANDKKIVVLRLALNLQDDQTAPQYFDVVAYNNQLVTFDAPVPDGSNMNITLKPVITEGNKIEVEINTRLNGSLKTNNTVTIADNSFKTLARVKTNGSWININATGQSLSNI
ncbi:MAG: hypothetical protein JXA96_05420 [Sedimentisphaerales bacterium]|nr:hypothetical protein [Sedimentisphaerales bacterium]